MKKSFWKGLALSVVVTVVFLALYLAGIFQIMENRSVDFRFSFRGDIPAHPGIMVITADEKSIKELGRWPWPRSVHGELVDWLTRAGAKTITFDVLFTEADKDRPWADAQLGRAAAKSGRVTFGMLFQQGEDGGPTNPLLPIPPLQNKRITQGSVNIFPETDGVTRKVPTWLMVEDQVVPSLSLKALSVALGKTTEELMEELKLPVEPSAWNELNLNFIGGFQSFPYFSFVDVYKKRVKPELFKDKIVLIGGTAVGLFDFKAVPNVSYFPGLEIHANALDNYLYHRYLRKMDWAWTIALLLAFGLGCGLLAARLPAWAGAVVAGTWLMAYFFLCQWLFSTKYLLLEFVAPSLTLLANYIVVLFYRFIVEQRERRRIKGTFSQYMSPKIVDLITREPWRLKLGGEEREMSVFFSDIAGFTSISEAMSPANLVAVLNEYLTEMSDIIMMKHDGVVDKYIGDAIMAFWNAPVDQPRHAANACFAALDQLEKLAELQKKFAERKLPLIDCRIGINTGHVVVGNMGSKNRFDYTVMGDAVNLASRLEGANKPYHTRIMISEFTYEKAKDDVEVRQLDLLRVKGKAIPIKVFELVARKGQLAADKQKAYALYGEGLSLYYDRKFDKAIGKFKKVLEALPEDGPSQLYIQRAEGYLASPPPKDWDGVFVMTTK